MQRILTRHNFYSELAKDITQAKERIIIDAYIWVHDETGLQIAEALLKAANKGIQIFIRKDSSASIYEHTPGRFPFFITKKELQTKGLLSKGFFNKLGHHIYGGKKRAAFKGNPLLKKLKAHPNIHIDDLPLFNHGKQILIDDFTYIGGQCISNDYKEWIDYCVKTDETNFTYLENTFKTHKDIYQHMKEFIESTKKNEELFIEMAYFGMWFFPILKKALNKGVKLRILASKNSDTNQNTNLYFLHKLLRRKHKNLEIYLSERMIHSKSMLKGSALMLGAANFHSACGYFKALNEQNIYSTNKELTKELQKHFQKDFAAATQINHSKQLPAWSLLGSCKERCAYWISTIFILFNKKQIQKNRNHVDSKLK